MTGLPERITLGNTFEGLLEEFSGLIFVSEKSPQRRPGVLRDSKLGLYIIRRSCD